LLGEAGGIELLGEDLALEIGALHKLVGVAGVAILAAELAAAVGVDGPAEGDALAGDAGDVGAGGKLLVLDLPLGFKGRAFGGEFGNPDELAHAPMFAFCSL